MAGLFDNFNKTMGVKPERIDAQQTETLVSYGTFYRDLTGKAGKPEAALSMQDGRHEVSSVVLNQYAVAGVEVDANVRSMMDELDNLAVASQSIAAMDNETRINLIARGNHGADPMRIKQREAELVRKIADATRNVVTEKEQIQRVLLREQRVQTELQTDKLIRNDETEREFKRYVDLTKDMTASELQNAYNGAGVPGVPRVALASIMSDRAKLEQETYDNTVLRDPKKSGLFGFGTNVTSRGGNRSGGSNSLQAQINDQAEAISLGFAPGVIGKLIDDHDAANVIAARNGEEIPPIQTVKLPTGDDVNINVLRIAQTKALERENKLSEAELSNFRRMAPIVNRTYETAMVRFSEQLDAIGLSTNNIDVNLASAFYRDQDAYRLATAAGDIGAMKAAVEAIEQKQAKLIEQYIETLPEERRAVIEQIVYTGKPVTLGGKGGVSDALGSMAGNELALAAKSNPMLAGNADYMNLTISQAERTATQAANDSDGRQSTRALAGDKDEAEYTSDDRRVTIEQNYDSGVAGQIIIDNTAEDIFSMTTYMLLNEKLDAAQQQLQVNNNPQAQAQVQELQRVRQALFGKNHTAMRLVGDGKLEMIRERREFQAFGNDGRPVQLTLPDGSPATEEVVRHDIVFDLLPEMDKRLQAVGINSQLGNEVMIRAREMRDIYIDRYRPKNPAQKMLLASAVTSYATDNSINDREAVGQVVDVTLGVLNDAMVKQGVNTVDVKAGDLTSEQQAKWFNERVTELLNDPTQYTMTPLPNGQTPSPYLARRQARAELLKRAEEGAAVEVPKERLSQLVDEYFTPTNN